MVVAVEGDGNIAVEPDTALDGFGVFFAVEQGFPGVDMLGFVEITAGDEGQALEANGIEDVVAIGDFPGIDERGVLVLVFPKVKGVLTPDALEFVWVGGDGKAALFVDGVNGVEDGKGWIDRLFEIDTQEVGGIFGEDGVFVEFQADHDNHAILAPGAVGFAADGGEVGVHFIGGEDEAGEVDGFADELFGIANVVGDGDAVEAALAVEIDEFADGQLAVGEGGVCVQITME